MLVHDMPKCIRWELVLVRYPINIAILSNCIQGNSSKMMHKILYPIKLGEAFPLLY